MKMDITACIDNQFAMPTGVMLYSVCVNNPDVPIAFHIITSPDVTDDNKKRIERTVTTFPEKSICFYDFTCHSLKRFPALERRKNITEVTYYRLWLAEVLPANIEKILYLDGDIIVRHSLESLWNTDIRRHAIAAVPNMNENNTNRYLRLGIPQQNGYFNAGVLLVNLSWWRRENSLDQFIDVINKVQDRLHAHDQDVLNIVFNNARLSLPIKYNLQSGHLYAIPQYDFKKYQDEVMEAREDPVIIHYTLDKPWYTYNRYTHPFSNSFVKYQMQTEWKDEPLWEIRSKYVQVRKRIAITLRRLGILPELQPNGCEYINIKPID